MTKMSLVTFSLHLSSINHIMVQGKEIEIETDRDRVKKIRKV